MAPASLAQLVEWLLPWLGGTEFEYQLGWPFMSYHLILVCVNYDLNGSLRINSRLHARLHNQISHPIPLQWNTDLWLVRNRQEWYNFKLMCLMCFQLHILLLWYKGCWSHNPSKNMHFCDATTVLMKTPLISKSRIRTVLNDLRRTPWLFTPAYQEGHDDN